MDEGGGASDTVSVVFTDRFFLKLMNDVCDHNQVEKLACFLGVRQPTIAQLKREYGGDPALMGMNALRAWHQDLMCDDVEEARRELAGALKKVGMGKKAKEVWPQIGSQPTSSKTSLIPMVNEQTKLTIVERPPPHNKCTCVSCRWLFCYIILFIVLALAVIGLLVLNHVPKSTDAVFPPSVKANDTVELDFSLATSWLHRLTLSINGDCNGTVYTIPGECSDLYHNARVCYQRSAYTTQLPVYLLAGSSITFKVPSNFSSQVNIWVVWNVDLIDHAFTHTPCGKPPQYTSCLQPQKNQSHETFLSFNVSQSAYYSIAFPNGRSGIENFFNICTIDIHKLSPSTQRSVLSYPVDVDILYKQFSFSEVCVLFHVWDDNYVCQQNTNGGELTAVVQRRQDVLLYPGLFILLAVLLLAGVFVSHIIRFVVKRRRCRPADESEYAAIINNN